MGKGNGKGKRTDLASRKKRLLRPPRVEYALFCLSTWDEKKKLRIDHEILDVSLEEALDLFFGEVLTSVMPHMIRAAALADMADCPVIIYPTFAGGTTIHMTQDKILFNCWNELVRPDGRGDARFTIDLPEGMHRPTAVVSTMFQPEALADRVTSTNLVLQIQTITWGWVFMTAEEERELLDTMRRGDPEACKALQREAMHACEVACEAAGLSKDVMSWRVEDSDLVN